MTVTTYRADLETRLVGSLLTYPELQEEWNAELDGAFEHPPAAIVHAKAFEFSFRENRPAKPDDVINRINGDLAAYGDAAEIVNHMVRKALPPEGFAGPAQALVDKKREREEDLRAALEPTRSATEKLEVISAEAVPPEFTDDALALEFSRRYGNDWRFVHPWGTWLKWNGVSWVTENTLDAFDRARIVCREMASTTDKPRVAARITNAVTVAAVERMARADRRHAATTDQWDNDPWLLNTPKGIVDLRTGQTQPPDRLLYMTKATGAAPHGDCPDWLQFLDDVTDGDRDLQAYLARVVGYCLTGSTIEQALFFAHGTGGNGKTVFINVVRAVLGQYASTAPFDTFLESKNDRHPTDLASLRGARFVAATEVDSGRRWAEARIKTLTGSEAIKARFMRQDFFEYVPAFKLFVAGNHRPSLRNVDEAIRRRFHLIPFTVQIPPEKRDKNLTQKLLKEVDGIMNWALTGCLEWQRVGLNPPEAVTAATQEYFAAEDALGRWMGDCCYEDAQATETTEGLFQSWKTWAENAGEFAGSQKKFSQDIRDRGFKKWREPGTNRMGFRGIAVNAPH